MSGANAKVYDERGALLQDLHLPNPLPMLAAGRNEVQLTCDAPAKSGVRATVTVISSGEPFRGRAANVLQK